MRTAIGFILALLLATMAMGQANQAGLSWTASTGATGYKVYCGNATVDYNAPCFPVDVLNFTDHLAGV